MLAERLLSLVNSNEILLKSLPATISYSSKMESVFQKVRRRLSLQCNINENSFYNTHEMDRNEKTIFHPTATDNNRVLSSAKSESYVKSAVQEKSLGKRKFSVECCEKFMEKQENVLSESLQIQNKTEFNDSHHHEQCCAEKLQNKRCKMLDEKAEMFEFFQPWALKTYGDQAKTKTITLKKKMRILKALVGQEHSNPDSSKFRFWVKSKGFTTKTPECFLEKRASDNLETNLFVICMSKDFGEPTYRKVAVVEEFFDIIYNVHVELGGRNGRHAGQKRTYRIITETYGFLPREAVTKFLSICPECQKNLRPCSPCRVEEHATNESFSELDLINCSSHTESSIDSAQHGPIESVHIGKTAQNHLKLPTSSVSPKSVKNAMVQEIQLEKVSSPDTENYSHSQLFPKEYQASNYNNSENSQDNLLYYYQLFQRFSQSSQISQFSQFTQFSQFANIFNQPRNEDTLFQSFSLIKPPLIEPEAQSLCAKSETFFKNISGTQKSGPNLQSTKSNSFNQNSQTQMELKNSTIPYQEINEPTQIPKLTNTETEQLSAINFSFSSSSSSSIVNKGRTPPIGKRSPQCSEQRHKECTKVPTIDLETVKPITSTYLTLTRSMGLADEDALKIDDLEPLGTPSTDNVPDPNPEDPYAGLMKDADKLKLMLLAWNYQNSNAVRNGTDGPDLGVVGGLWAQYQNALAMSTTKSEPTSGSPIPRAEQSSPMETQDETNSSGQKDDDEGSDDESDDKIDVNSHDPERLKAFNMFVRLFVDENLDRMIPISKQPKEKIQAIIDSCSRQFPEFSERSRKRIRTYLKSCRRNKKTREGWDNTSRPTPAHLTSVQAEQILAIACENESMNAKRMRVGLDPISQSLPLASTSSNTAVDTIAPSTTYPNFRTTPNLTTSEAEAILPITTATHSSGVARTSPLALNAVMNSDAKLMTGSSVINGTNNPLNVQNTNPLFRPTDYTTPSSTSPFSSRSSCYPPYFSPSTNGGSNATPTDLSMKPNSNLPNQTLTSSSTINPSQLAPPPLITHKLSVNELTAARQVISAYRESAAFLLRTADQVEQLLIQQQ